MKRSFIYMILCSTILLAGCGQNQIDKLIEENNYNKTFIDECIYETSNIINDVFEVITGTVKVNKIYDYKATENDITTMIEFKFDVNPIRAIHHTDTYSCTKTGNNATIVKFESMKTEDSACPDGSMPPSGFRCDAPILNK